MTTKTISCIVLDCDVCGDRFEDDDGVYHLKTIGDFVEINADWDPDCRWLIQPDGYAVCAFDDESHASVREPLKPKLPLPEIPGQLSLIEDGGAS